MKKFFVLVICLLILCSATAQASTKPFIHSTSEGFSLTGTMYLPNSTNKVPLVVLLHSIGGDKTQWGNLPNILTQNNFACLALDFRGHGSSVFNKFEKRCSWMYFTDRDFSKYPSDTMGAIKEAIQSYKIINPSNIILIGNNIGANTAILTANKMNRKYPCVKSLVLISPRTNLKSLNVSTELVKFGERPVLIFCNKNIPKDLADGKELKRHCEGACTFQALDSTGMASSFYKNTPSIETEIINWLKAL